MKYDYIIVGAGFFGSVLAERLTSIKKKVLVLEKRNHIGGNCFSYFDQETNINIHKYGTHIFHTNNKEIWDYINNFTKFNNYRHKVLSSYRNKVYSMPVNLHTINKIHNKNFNPDQAIKYFKKIISKKKSRNLEEQAVNFVGSKIYNKLIKGYTSKQWQMNPKLLPSSIINRLPIRYNYNDFYFDDIYQGIPIDGYTPIFEKLLKKSEVHLNCDFFKNRDYFLKKSKKIIYTGPLDMYFDYSFGQLGWRSLKFKLKKLKNNDFQGTSVMNYSDMRVKYTRIHEFKHLHPEKKINSGTIIMREYPETNNLDPYYPIRTEEDMILFSKYSQLAKLEKNVIFGGRLAGYKYLDMHQVIASALALFKSIE